MLTAIQVYKPKDKNELRLVYKEGKARHQKSYPVRPAVGVRPTWLKACHAMLFIKATGLPPPHFECRANGCKNQTEPTSYDLLPGMLNQHLFFIQFQTTSAYATCAEGCCFSIEALGKLPDVAGIPLDPRFVNCPNVPALSTLSDVAALYARYSKKERVVKKVGRRPRNKTVVNHSHREPTM